MTREIGSDGVSCQACQGLDQRVPDSPRRRFTWYLSKECNTSAPTCLSAGKSQQTKLMSVENLTREFLAADLGLYYLFDLRDDRNRKEHSNHFIH
jgi:hypothetical protein